MDHKDDSNSKRFIMIGISFCILIVLWQEIFKKTPTSPTVVYVDNKNIEEDLNKSESFKDNDEEATKEKININSSSETDLQNLPGIGKNTASRIVEKRNEIGGFKNIEDIKMVKGVGDKKFQEIKELICT